MTLPSPLPIKTGMLDSLMGYHLRRAQSAVFAEFMRSMADDQVTPGQFGVLVLIDENPGLNQSALAKALGIERSTMVGVIDMLEHRRLIERRKSPTDKRAHALALTDQGRRLLEAVKPKVGRHERRVMDCLSQQEADLLMSLLKRITL